MHRFAVSLLAVFFAGALPVHAVAQTGSTPGAGGGNPTNTVPYGGSAGAQAPPTHAGPAPSTPSGPPAIAAYSGCVLQSATDKETLVMSAESVCATLSGTLSASKLAGHEIDLKGVLSPRAGATPASIKVDSVVHVGKSCSDVCSLLPPKKRGLGGEIPGKEGGTPGLTPTKPAQ